ncbi:MAG: DsbA family protein [Campylobacteraceae bacterium]|nr:DsbA family protein [Campylobacteraceae bacterium]
MKNTKNVKKKKNNLLIAAILIVVFAIFGVGAYFYSDYQKNNTMSKEELNALVRDYSPVSGNPNAKVTVVEFLNPSCAACIRFSPNVESLIEQHGDKIRVVYKVLPFSNDADSIIPLLKAANEQGKFKETLKLFFSQFNRWFIKQTTGYYQVNHFAAWGILQEAGIDAERAQNFLSENAAMIKEQIEQDADDAKSLGVTGTPTFFVNGKRIVEKLSPDGNELFRLVESEIKKVY